MAKSISKELKQPDEFVSFWTRLGEWAARFARERRQALIVGSTMLVTVIVGSIIFSNISEHRGRTASDALARIERLAAGELRAEGQVAPDGMPFRDDGIPHFKTEQERAEAALKELEAFAVESGNPLRAQARLERAQLLLALGRAPDAAKAYEELLAGKLDDGLRFLAREGQGYALEQKGDLPGALAAFEKLGDEPGGKDRAGYHKARLAELRGNPDEAKKLYREVLDKNPTTSLRDEINNRLAVLELK